ncbi:MAG: PAS domain-containing protein [Deltaproteobacteria bacterium]|nr:PAS domain-containing protein [Deltaproteobacteria bacterium]
MKSERESMSVPDGEKAPPSLEEVRDYYHNILAGLVDGIVVVDAALRIMIFSASAEQMTGLKAQNVQDRTMTDVFAGEKKLHHLVEKTLTTGRGHTDSSFSFKTFRREHRSLGLTTSPLLDRDGNPSGVVIVFRDLTRMKSLEERVRQGERLASLGVLAAGMAHEIKNPLGGIRGAAQLLREELSSESSCIEYTDVMIREVDRLNKIVEGLLDFSRPAPLHLRAMNVHQVLDHVAELVKMEYGGRSISIVREYDPSLPEIVGDPDPLTQVFLNFCRNGIDAMGGAGELTLTTRILPGYQVRRGDSVKRRMISVEVKDRGCGIPAENLKKIFLPFYTGKPDGVGLGLALCHRMIEEHGGKIDVVSRPDEGTCVRTSLPVAAATEL